MPLYFIVDQDGFIRGHGSAQVMPTACPGGLGTVPAAQEQIDLFESVDHQARRVRWEAENLVLVDREVDFQGLVDAKVRQLEAATRRFIETKPDGSKRYTQEKQASFNSIFQICRLKLDDPSTAVEVADACRARMSLLLEVFGWIGAVLDYHYQVDAALRGAVDQAELDAILWDFSALDAGAPDVRLQEVRL